MDKLIEIKTTDGTTTYINPRYIMSIFNDMDGEGVIRMSNEIRYRTKENALQIANKVGFTR